MWVVNLIDDTLVKNIVLDSDYNEQNIEIAKNLILKCKLQGLEKSLTKEKIVKSVKMLEIFQVKNKE